MPKRTYLRPPNDDYAPDNNIRLGHVWRKPRDPGTSIGDPLPVPPNIMINKTHKGSWTLDTTAESQGNIGFWTKIFQIIPKAGVQTSWGKSQKSVYTIPTMDTYSIEPTQDYVEASIRTATEYINCGSSLYMITGVKIARGGDGSNRQSQRIGIDAAASISGTAASIPIDTGAKISYSSGVQNSQGFTSADDFVFAYRVREIIYDRKAVKTRQYNKGAVLGENMVSIDQSRIKETEFVLEKAEAEDEDLVDEGEKVQFVDDDDEQCEFIF